MFLDCSQQSPPPISKLPFKIRGIYLGREVGGGVRKENISTPYYLESHFSTRLQEIWLSLPVSPAAPRGHVRWTGRLDMQKRSTDPPAEGQRRRGSGISSPPLSGWHKSVNGISSEYNTTSLLPFSEITLRLNSRPMRGAFILKSGIWL